MKNNILILIFLLSVSFVNISCERQWASEENLLGTWKMAEIDYHRNTKKFDFDKEQLIEINNTITLEDTIYRLAGKVDYFTPEGKFIESTEKEEIQIIRYMELDLMKYHKMCARYYVIRFENCNDSPNEEYNTCIMDEDDCNQTWESDGRNLLLRKKISLLVPEELPGTYIIDYLGENEMVLKQKYREGRRNDNYILDGNEYYKEEVTIVYKRIN